MLKEDLDRGDKALGCAKWLDAFLRARGITTKEYFTSKYKGPAPETKFSKTFKGIGYRRDQEDEKWVEREKITETFYVDWSTVFPDSAIDEQPDDACVTEPGDADMKDVSIQGAEQRDASDEVPMDVDDSDSSFEPESESESEDEEDEEDVDGDEEPIEDNARVEPPHALLKTAVAARLQGYEFDAKKSLTYGDLIDADLISEIHYVFKNRASSMADEDWKTPLDRDALFDMRIPDNDAQFFWCPKN
ncbi:hypothetical protein EXIGLDRAFT_753917 [Exidia glandulosa HHB12029]|uniref:Uncharacterized protein n=1 Tax=Exidia glandulosa HHB12029 TaxID=1314781 RepID=A0A165ZNC1_EXIGL|nr:hypothetical protein EXIGLDRAFT_753917 [Exidia glandulosa HHB12029]